MMTNFDRRLFIGGVAGTALGALAGVPAAALSNGQATSLVSTAIDDVNGIIGSGASEARMLREFEGLFSRYADTAYIAAFALGNDRRSASPAQLRNFSSAFGTYVARKYGRRFREFVGSQFDVQGARPENSYVVVESTATLRGRAPFQVDWHVSDRPGRPAFFNLIIEGVNMLLTERTEVGALLDRRGGNIDALITDLRNV